MPAERNISVLCILRDIKSIYFFSKFVQLMVHQEVRDELHREQDNKKENVDIIIVWEKLDVASDAGPLVSLWGRQSQVDTKPTS